MSKSNVLSIARNPRFKAKDELIPKPDNVTQKDQLVSYTMASNLYGFCIGDKIICRQNFNQAELKPTSLVVGRNESGKQNVTVAALADDILAVVVAYQREVI